VTVGIVVVSHSAALAAAAGELAREMAGESLRMALAGGVDDEEAPLGTDAVKVMAAIEELDSEAGVLVLMDLGSAVLSAEMAVDLLPPETAARVVLCEAPIVEGLIAAAVQAAAGAGIDEVAAEARRGLEAKASHLGVEPAGGPRAPAPAPAQAEAAGTQALTAELTVPNALGFHARPAARIVQALGPMDATVTVTDTTTGRGPVPARSLNGLITLGAQQGHVLALSATGPDAAAALEALRALAEDNLGDPLEGHARAGTEPLAPAAGGGEPDADTGTGPASDRGTGPAPDPGADPGLPDVLTGLAGAPGVSVGPVQLPGGVPWPELEAVPDPATSPDPDEERARLDRALATAAERLTASRDELERRAGVGAAEMVGAQLLLLEDPAVLEPARAAIDAGDADAAGAWAAAVRDVLATYGEVEDDYLAERAADLRAIGREVLADLLGVERGARTPRGVVVAEDLSPGETAKLDPDEVDGIVTAAGSPTAHAALLARALGIPAVVAVGPRALLLEEGREVAVDGTTGRVETAPDATRIAQVRERRAEAGRARGALRVAAAGPAVTRDGTSIEVGANVGLPAEAARAAHEGADGVGLLRSEFLFLDRDRAPDEEEQVASYTAVCEALTGRPVVLRTLDVGGDKPLPYIDLPVEANPFLGTRAVRLGLRERALFTTQLRAALRVAAVHPLHLLLPMVATLAEIEAVRGLLDDARVALLDEGLPAAEHLPLGVMVEIPALALKAAHLVDSVDLLSIGTNDLTQYTMAAERGNPALAELADPLDPAVLRLVGEVGAAAVGHDVKVSVCGDVASDPELAGLLLGLGARALSVPPIDVPAVKEAVRGVDLEDARRLASRAMAAASAAEVRALLRD